MRYITDFYVKGFRPFMEPEYVVLVAKGKPPAVGYISGSDDLRIRFKSDIEDARKLPPLSRLGRDDRRDDLRLRPRAAAASAPT